MPFKRFKIAVMFTLPLPDKRYANTLIREIHKRIQPSLGVDVMVRSEVKQVKRSQLAERFMAAEDTKKKSK